MRRRHLLVFPFFQNLVSIEFGGFFSIFDEWTRFRWLCKLHVNIPHKGCVGMVWHTTVTQPTALAPSATAVKWLNQSLSLRFESLACTIPSISFCKGLKSFWKALSSGFLHVDAWRSNARRSLYSFSTKSTYVMNWRRNDVCHNVYAQRIGNCNRYTPGR